MLLLIFGRYVNLKSQNVSNNVPRKFKLFCCMFRMNYSSTNSYCLHLNTNVAGSKSEREKKNHSAESEDVLLMSLPIGS